MYNYRGEQFQNQKQRALGLETLVDANNVLMVQLLQNHDFVQQSVWPFVGKCLFQLQLLFIDDLARVSMSGVLVNAPA
jgi:hypothetical protein